MGDTADGGGGMPIPPAGKALAGGAGAGGQRRGAVDARGPPSGGIAIEDRADRRDKIIDARIGEALPARLMERKLPREAEDVPGIDRRAAADGAEEQLCRLVEIVEGPGGAPGGPAAADGRLGGDDPARDPGEHPRRGGRHERRHPRRPLGSPQPRKDTGQCHRLHLAGTAAGEEGVDMTADAPEGLPEPLHLDVESAAVIRLEARQHPPVKLVPVAGDPGEEFGERGGGLMGAGTVAGEPRRHEHDAGEDGGRLEPELRDRPGVGARRGRSRGLGPGEDAVEGRLLDDHPAIAAALVDPGRIPEPEEIVRAAGGGMEKVEGARIDRQLLEGLEVEIGLRKKRVGSGGEDGDGPGDELAIPAMGGPDPGHPQRHRPDAFVGIGFRKPTVLEDGDGAPTDVVVEAPDRLLDDARGRRATGKENGLGDGHDRKRPLQRPGGLMLEEVAVKPAIARQNLVKHHPDQAAGLAGIAEGRLGCLQLREALPQQCRDVRGRIGPFPLRLGGGKQIGTGPPDGRIKGPRGEIEIPEEERGWIGGARRFRSDRHRQASYGSPGHRGVWRQTAIVPAGRVWRRCGGGGGGGTTGRGAPTAIPTTVGRPPGELALATGPNPGGMVAQSGVLGWCARGGAPGVVVCSGVRCDA